MEQKHTLENSLKLERQQKSEAILMLDNLKTENFNENEIIVEKDKQIENLRQELDNFKVVIQEYKTKIDGYSREQVGIYLFIIFTQFFL